MNARLGNSLEEQEPDVVKQRELQALAELVQMHDMLKKRLGVYQRDMIAAVRVEREQNNERVRRGEL